MSDSGNDELAAAGVAGHEVRLHQADHDAQVRLDKAPVHQDRDSGRRSAEVDMGGAVPGEVIGGGYALENDLGADDLPQLGALVGPVQAGRNEDQDIFPRHPCGRELLDERRQQRAVGDRPGDVADQDARCLASAGQLPQRRPGNGLPEGCFQLFHGIGRERHLLLADGADLKIVRERHGKLAAAVQQFDSHLFQSCVIISFMHRGGPRLEVVS